ncbi:uncharacterized protein LOC125561881 [Nematostella vectensis]|uniref:uncharacterized protein LOC125561881 n=1 Tax=Nematostella vectensis TaxID=45351 RepID=UPI0020774728|nr:uncharacterized protein LOC125561881 [Nematostella vectensis]
MATTGQGPVLFVPLREPPIIPRLQAPRLNHNNQGLELPTPVSADRLASLLVGYDAVKVSILFNGFQFGFALHYEGSRESAVSGNLLSTKDNPEAVDKKLITELQAGRLAGPFVTPPLVPFRVSPLGLVPKKLPGDFRLIHHLSYPKGLSVNDGISLEHSTVRYATIGDAISKIRAAGRGCFLTKTDIKNAFRIIPVRPQDYNLLGMQWKGFYYHDRCMPMGCSSSCKTFELFSTALEWIALEKLRLPQVVHLLDDFLFISPSQHLGVMHLNLFLDVCNYLGVPIAPEKTLGPSTTLSFAGIELDTILFEARLPVDKIQKCLDTISKFLTRKKVTLRELQSLNGLLNFACSVVVPGRAFLRRLIDLTIGINSPLHYIRLSREVKADLRVWQCFLEDFNGKSFFLEDTWHSSDKLKLYTDASGAIGFGAVFGNKWCYGTWPDNWKHRNIAILEFYPIVLSLLLWGNHMSNRCILFLTDNEALVHVINKQSCKDKELMFFVRQLVLTCLKNNIFFKAKHIPGVRNSLADSLSRLQLQRFRLMAPPTVDQLPAEIPAHLQPQNLQLL